MLKKYIQVGAKNRFTAVSMRNRVHLVLLVINRIIFHTNNCKPIFAPPCIYNQHMVAYYDEPSVRLYTATAYKDDL